MKKVVLTLTASLACLAAFAQGKISFQTDSAHLAYYAGTSNAISSANLPSGGLGADLYMGTSSGSLFLYSSTTFGATPGKWNSVSVAANANANGAPAIPGGSTVFVVAQIRGGGNTPANQLNGALLGTAPDTYAATLGYTAYGWSQEFTFTLGSSISYPFMYTAPSWAPGTTDLSSTAGAGALGAIAVTVPEPTSMVLLGLGSAALLIFRRRK